MALIRVYLLVCFNYMRGWGGGAAVLRTLFRFLGSCIAAQEGAFFQAGAAARHLLSKPLMYERQKLMPTPPLHFQ